MANSNSADVVVVGSGVAGGLVAHQLATAGASVILLEAGPRLNGSALAANLVDRLFLFYAPKIAGHSNAPVTTGPTIAKLAFREKTLREFGVDFAIDALLHNYFEL